MIISLINLDWSFAYLIAQSNYRFGDATVELYYLIIRLAIYLFYSYCFYAILQKLEDPNAWFVWVPLLQFSAIYKAGNQSPWWTIVLLIPYVKIVAWIVFLIAFVNIIKKLGKNPWLILLMIIPLVNYAVMCYFAFG